MKINGIECKPIPLTLKNEIICRNQYNKAREFIQSRNIEVAIRNIARLRKNHEPLREFIDDLGMINQASILIYAQRLKDNHLVEWNFQAREAQKQNKSIGDYDPLTDEVARGIAEEELQSNLKLYLKDNPQIGKALYFDTESFPPSLDGLHVGVEILRDTLDRSHLTVEECALIDGPFDNDYWQNVAASEVAEYVTNFCALMR